MHEEVREQNEEWFHILPLFNKVKIMQLMTVLSITFLAVSGNLFFLSVCSTLVLFFDDGRVISCRRLFKGQTRVEYAADPCTDPNSTEFMHGYIIS